MGAWGCGNLENDDALDWLSATVDSGCIEAVQGTLSRAAPPTFLEAPDACNSLAAAELVAAALDRPHPLLPERVGRWLAIRGPRLDPALREQALRAVRNIRVNSELQELWEEFGAEEWYRELDDLESRLA